MWKDLGRKWEVNFRSFLKNIISPLVFVCYCLQLGFGDIAVVEGGWNKAIAWITVENISRKHCFLQIDKSILYNANFNLELFCKKMSTGSEYTTWVYCGQESNNLNHQPEPSFLSHDHPTSKSNHFIRVVSVLLLGPVTAFPHPKPYFKQFINILKLSFEFLTYFFTPILLLSNI